MRSTHAPAPWNESGYEGHIYVVSEGRPLCRINTSFWSESEVDANAQLISSAPALYEALVDLAACAETFDEFHDPTSDWYPVLFAVRDALDKAEGRHA